MAKKYLFQQWQDGDPNPTKIVSVSPKKVKAIGNGLFDAAGNPVTLISVTVDHNEFYRGFFDASDVARMQLHGGNCLEIHTLRLGFLMPQRGILDLSYLQSLDGYVNICETAGMYCIVNIEDLSWTSWGSGMPDWMLDGHGYGNAPYTEDTVNRACIDFWDLDNPLHNDNRQTFIDLWKTLADRYKNKQYAIFSIMNEPISHCTITSRAQSQHLGLSYAQFMEQIVDAVQSVADNLIVVDRPYVWYLDDVQPVQREGIMWEDHYYADADTPTAISTWKAGVDAMIKRFMIDFNKPLIIGEYGPYPTNITGWLNVFTQQHSYLLNKVPGYAWHTWGVLNGEYSNMFSASDSELLLKAVYPK